MRAYEGRRIITGHDQQGKSVVLSAGQAVHTRALPGANFFEIWATTQSPAPVTPIESAEPTSDEPKIHPARGGSVLRVIDFLPRGQGGVRSPMHRTSTIDYGIVLEGEIVLIMSDSEIVLQRGDIVIQRGTDHAWENRSEKPARMAFILLDGEFSEELKAIISDTRLMA